MPEMQILEYRTQSSAAAPKGDSGGELKAIASNDIIFFFHGFPAVRSRQNRELAQQVSQINSVYTIVPLYSGLGFTEGEFRFSSCVNEVRDWALQLTSQKIAEGWQGRLKFVGHSWGGFLSLLLANEPLLKSRLQKIVLMSPLVHFAASAMAAMAFEIVQQDNPHLALGSIEHLANDFAEVAKRYPTSRLIGNLDPGLETEYWQARVDRLTPPEAAELMRPKFPGQLNFEIVDQDHSFLKDRATLARKLADALR